MWKTVGWGTGSLHCIKTDLWKERMFAGYGTGLPRLQDITTIEIYECNYEDLMKKLWVMSFGIEPGLPLPGQELQ